MENNISNTSTPVSNYQGGTKKKSSILTIVFLLTTLGFGGAFAWAMLKDSGNKGGEKSSADVANQQVSTISQEQLENPTEGTVAEVVSDFNTDQEVRRLVREIKAAASGYVYTIDSSYDDGVNVFGNDYLSKTSKSYGVRSYNQIRDMGVAAGSSAIDYLRSSIISVLTDNGFTKNDSYATAMQRSLEDDGGTTGYYTKGDLVCYFTTGSNWFNINCASTKWFTAEDKAFADAVNKARGYNKDYYISANTNAITTTKDGKYEKAEVSVFPSGTTVGGFVDLYYRKVDGGEWTYITGTQGAPSCDDFSEEAAEAYKGTLCSYQDENGEWGSKYLGN